MTILPKRWYNPSVGTDCHLLASCSIAALMGCVILALIMIMFAGAPLIGGGMSWTASAALIGTAGWLCWVCYHLADEEMEDQE